MILQHWLKKKKYRTGKRMKFLKKLITLVKKQFLLDGLLVKKWSMAKKSVRQDWLPEALKKRIFKIQMLQLAHQKR